MLARLGNLIKERYQRYGWTTLLMTVLSSSVGGYLTSRYLETQLAPPEKVEGLPPPGSGSDLQKGKASPPSDAVAGAPSGAEPGAPGTDATAGAPGAPPAEGPVTPGAEPEAVVVANAILPLMDYEPILIRNLFDSANSLHFTSDEPISTDPSEPPPPPPLDVRLFGTVVSVPASYSWAIMSKNEDNAPQETFQIGEDLYGQGTLVSVRRNQVLVRRPDGEEQVVDRWVPGTATAPVAMGAAAKPDATGLGASVRQVGDNKFEIDAKELQNIMDNMDKVTSSARIVPSFENGNPVGFKIFRIKPDSLYNKLGLRNGDVISKINGFEVNSTEKALQMYQLLRTEKQLSLEVTRRGQKQNMDYTIR